MSCGRAEQAPSRRNRLRRARVQLQDKTPMLTPYPSSITQYVQQIHDRLVAGCANVEENVFVSQDHRKRRLSNRCRLIFALAETRAVTKM